MIAFMCKHVISAFNLWGRIWEPRQTRKYHISIYVYIYQKGHWGSAHEGPMAGHKGLAHNGTRRPTRARPTMAQGGPQGPGPQGHKAAHKGPAHNGTRRPTRAQPTMAQGGPQGPGPQGPQGSHKGHAHKDDLDCAKPCINAHEGEPSSQAGEADSASPQHHDFEANPPSIIERSTYQSGWTWQTRAAKPPFHSKGGRALIRSQAKGTRHKEGRSLVDTDTVPPPSFCFSPTTQQMSLCVCIHCVSFRLLAQQRGVV